MGARLSNKAFLPYLQHRQRKEWKRRNNQMSVDRTSRTEFVKTCSETQTDRLQISGQVNAVLLGTSINFLRQRRPLR